MSYLNYSVDFEQRPYNPDRMRKERLERAQAALKKYGLGAMIVYNFDTQRYLGYYPSRNYERRREGTFVLLIRDAGFPYTPDDPTGMMFSLMPWFKDRFKLTRSYQLQINQGFPELPEYMHGEFEKTAAEIKALLKEHDVFDLPCGIDMSNYTMIEACKSAGINLVDGNIAIAEARMIKTQDEIECLKMAGAISESAHWEVCQALRPGVTEHEIAGVAAKACLKLGADELEGPSFVVCSGERAGSRVPAMATDKIVRPGDMFVIDINGVGYQGYRSCFYGTYVVGDKPTEFQKDVYNCAYEGLMALTESVKPGLTTHEVKDIWFEKGRESGRWGAVPNFPEPGRYYPGSSGHSIGLASGDPGPFITGYVRGIEKFPPHTIEKNMTFALEVGCFVWDGCKWAKDGAKIEHVGVVTDTGFEVFYRFPTKELIACGLPGLY